MQRSEFTDITTQIARAKAAARLKGPWERMCPTCLNYYPEGKESEHRRTCKPYPYTKAKKATRKKPRHRINLDRPEKKDVGKTSDLSASDNILIREPNWESGIALCIKILESYTPATIYKDSQGYLRLESIFPIEGKRKLYAKVEVASNNQIEKFTWKLDEALSLCENRVTASRLRSFHDIYKEQTRMRSAFKICSRKKKLKKQAEIVFGWKHILKRLKAKKRSIKK